MNLLSQTFPFIVYLIMGLFLWFKAKTLSRFLIYDEDKDHKDQEIEKESYTNLQALVFSGIGLVFLVQAFPKIVASIPQIYYINQLGLSVDDKLFNDQMFFLFSNIVQLLIGLVLFFGARGLAGLLKKVREAGVPKG